MPLPARFRFNRGIIFLSFLSLGVLGLGWLYLNQAVTKLVTVDAQSGKVLWSTPFDDVTPIRRIINRKGQVYILAASRKEICGNWCIFPSPDVPGITEVTAFDAVSGKQLWQFKTGSNNLDWADIQVTENSVFSSARTTSAKSTTLSTYQGMETQSPAIHCTDERNLLIEVCILY
jgi:outer membrane protein assembly factor BamB